MACWCLNPAAVDVEANPEDAAPLVRGTMFVALKYDNGIDPGSVVTVQNQLIIYNRYKEEDECSQRRKVDLLNPRKYRRLVKSAPK